MINPHFLWAFVMMRQPAYISHNALVFMLMKRELAENDMLKSSMGILLLSKFHLFQLWFHICSFGLHFYSSLTHRELWLDHWSDLLGKRKAAIDRSNQAIREFANNPTVYDSGVKLKVVAQNISEHTARTVGVKPGNWSVREMCCSFLTI